MKMKISLFFVCCFLSFASSAAVNTCNKNTLGGGDLFPWGNAEPFRWGSIQGVWQVQDDEDMIMRFRVTRVDKLVRQLYIEIFSRSNCAKPVYAGPGQISSEQKNVVKAFINEKLMKIAWFDTTVLDMRPDQCGTQVLGFSILQEDEFGNTNNEIDYVSGSAQVRKQTEPSSQNFLLKKLSPSLKIYCKF